MEVKKKVVPLRSRLRNRGEIEARDLGKFIGKTAYGGVGTDIFNVPCAGFSEKIFQKKFRKNLEIKKKVVPLHSRLKNGTQK